MTLGAYTVATSGDGMNRRETRLLSVALPVRA